MSAIIEIELKELGDGKASMFFNLYDRNATKAENESARNLIALIHSGALDSGGKEIFRNDLAQTNPVTNGKN
jgi:hypothetical protein